MKQTVGIDLGTSNSSAAVLKDGRIRVVPSEDGQTAHGKMFLSTVAFREDGEVIVGKRALEYSHAHPERVVRWVKRRMGSDYTFSVEGVSYTPQDISSFILRKIKLDSERFLGEAIDQAVITVPAYFNNSQRNATRQAGELAGFDVLRIVSEPTAAALAYGLNQLDIDLNVAVLDLGAGTFDITILEMRRGVFKVRSTCGDTVLGGKDMDDAILSHLIREIERTCSIDVNSDPLCLSVLRDVAEKSKIKLSSFERVTVTPELPIGGEILRPRLVLTRSRLERLVDGLTSRLREPIMRALEDSALAVDDIDRLVLVGGPTKMPVVRRQILEIFGREAEEGIDPMNVVATGALIQGIILSGEIRDMLLMDVIPLSLGVETAGGVFTRLIPRNTTIPTIANRNFVTEEDGQTSMIIHVLQGERDVARGNTSLGLLKIEGIPPAPRFGQEVEVAFRVDADGILKVSAEVLSTGLSFDVPVRSVKELTEREIASKIIEATKFDDEDSKIVIEVRARENAKAILFGAERLFEEIRGSLTEEEKRGFSEALRRLEGSLTGVNVRGMKKSADALAEIVEASASKAKTLERMNLLAFSALRCPQGKSNGTWSLIESSMRKIKTASSREADSEVKGLREALLMLELDEEV